MRRSEIKLSTSLLANDTNSFGRTVVQKQNKNKTNKKLISNKRGRKTDKE